MTMPARLFDIMPIPHLNLILASAFALLAGAVDSMSDPVGWESVGLKTALIAAIVYLVREQTKLREAATAEATKREEKLLEVIKENTHAKEENTKALQALEAATDLQTAYYKTAVQAMLDRANTTHEKP